MKRFRDASFKYFTGQNKKLIHIPIKKAGTIHAAPGVLTIFVEVYGECRSCNEKVSFGRVRAGGQWIPVKEKNDEEGIYELHRCEAELKRNAELYHLIHGGEILSE